MLQTNILETIEMKHLWLTLLWILYFFIHSFLADIQVKGYFEKLLQKNYRYYRIFYNLLSTILLIPIFLYSLRLPTLYLIPKTSSTIILGLILVSLGIALGKVSFNTYNVNEFLGFPPLQSNKKEGSKLQTNGMLRYVRHPLYSATILIILGFWIFSPTLTNLVTVTAILVYTFLGIVLEEKKLVMEFGQDYIDYKKKTPMLIPRVKVLDAKR